MQSDSLNRYVTSKLASLRKKHRYRQMRWTERSPGASVRTEDGEYVSFACNDYLGLSHEPAVIRASVEATERFGTGAGASRLITGNHLLYAELEERLAALKRREAAIVFGSGYLTNVGVIPALVGSRDLICIDELAHSCMLSGARLAGSETLKFRHNDPDHLAKTLAAQRARYRNCLILTEHVFSMDGDVAPLASLATVASQHDAWLMSDDAHGLGVIASSSDGESQATETAVAIGMGTLSKAVGAYGGYVCASKNVCDFLQNRARTLIYSTGLPPGTIAAATKALEIVSTDKERTLAPLRSARLFTELTGLKRAESPIVPLIVGEADAALETSAQLAQHGFLVPAIRPPTVPTGRARLRIAFTAMHEERDVRRLADAVNSIRGEV